MDIITLVIIGVICLAVMFFQSRTTASVVKALSAMQEQSMTAHVATTSSITDTITQAVERAVASITTPAPVAIPSDQLIPTVPGAAYEQREVIDEDDRDLTDSFIPDDARMLVSAGAFGRGVEAFGIPGLAFDPNRYGSFTPPVAEANGSPATV